MPPKFYALPSLSMHHLGLMHGVQSSFVHWIVFPAQPSLKFSTHSKSIPTQLWTSFLHSTVFQARPLLRLTPLSSWGVPCRYAMLFILIRHPSSLHALLPSIWIAFISLHSFFYHWKVKLKYRPRVVVIGHRAKESWTWLKLSHLHPIDGPGSGGLRGTVQGKHREYRRYTMHTAAARERVAQRQLNTIELRSVTRNGGGLHHIPTWLRYSANWVMLSAFLGSSAP